MQQIVRLRLAFMACLAALGFAGAPAGAAAAAPTPSIHHVANRVVADNDHGGRPFAVVDKRRATIAVYRADGSLAGSTVVLLGQSSGDRSVPGVGERTQAGTLRPDDLTTPAGRFDSEPGRNLAGERIVWLDYGAAFAIHRLRRDRSHAERARRLASHRLDDNRVSNGCVVVPESFYDDVVQPLLGRSRGVVYVLPENGDHGVFDRLLEARAL